MLRLLFPGSHPKPAKKLPVEKAAAIKQKKEITPLERRLDAARLAWLGVHLNKRWHSLYGSLSTWRQELEINAKEADNDFKHRRENRNDDGVPTIFPRQNDTLGIIGGLSEFRCAQSKNDLFGGEPWCSTKPEGKSDRDLADLVQKFMSFKLKDTNVLAVFREAVDLASILGTVFIKCRWHTVTDEWEEEITVLHKDGAPVIIPEGTRKGDYLYHTDAGQQKEAEDGSKTIMVAGGIEIPLPQGRYEYQGRIVKRTAVRYASVKASCLHFKDVAFDPTAPELSLEHTDFFHRFEIRLSDAQRLYGLTAEQVATLKDHGRKGNRSEHRKDGVPSTQDDGEDSGMADFITLVECFTRTNIFNDGKLYNVYSVLSPEAETVLKTNYLAAVSPDGQMPVFRHRIYPKALCLLGTSFFEKFRYAGTSIDARHSRINLLSRKSGNPITGVDRSALEEEEGEDARLEFDPDKVHVLKEGKKIDDYVSFAKMPPPDGVEKDQLGTEVQLLQLRSGMTSATQGDVAGVPEANTATGTKALIARGAALLKVNIDEEKLDFEAALNYVAMLIIANQNEDETFIWGEGEAQELLELRAEAVKGLRLNLRLLMSQSQNIYKLEYAQKAIQLVLQWFAVPEMEKTAARALFLQALKALEFQDADSIIRKPVITPDAILPMLPPELQPMFQNFLASLGVQPGGESSPSTSTSTTSTSSVPLSPSPSPSPSPPAADVQRDSHQA